MKILNKLTIEKLEAESSGYTLEFGAATIVCKDGDNIINTSNYTQFLPHIIDAVIINDNCFGIALHKGGDTRGNYTDYYLFECDYAEEVYDYTSDRIEIELTSQAECDQVIELFKQQNWAIPDALYNFDDETIVFELDCDNYTRLNEEEVSDINCDTDKQWLLYELLTSFDETEGE